MRGLNTNTVPFYTVPFIKHWWILVSVGVVEPIPQGYQGIAVHIEQGDGRLQEGCL